MNALSESGREIVTVSAVNPQAHRLLRKPAGKENDASHLRPAVTTEALVPLRHQGSVFRRLDLPLRMQHRPPN
jgi:hypothetical protein